jgi:transposase
MPVFVGIDVAKETHWVTAVDEQARIVHDGAVVNDQAALVALTQGLKALGDEVVVALDVTGSIATFLEAVLAGEGLALVHVSGIAVNRAGQGYAGGERKSDPRDARTIADLARTRPGLRPILRDDATTVALRLLVSRRGDLVVDQTRRLSRLRQLLSQVHPGLERRLDVTKKAPLALLTRYVTPTEIRTAGARRIAAHLDRTPHLRDTRALADEVVGIAKTQTIAVPGEAIAAELIRELATEASAAKTRIAAIDRELEALLAVHPDGALIRSLPGMGVVLAAEFLAHLGTVQRFHSADALAAAAGLAPVLRQSGRSRTFRRATGGDRALKRALFQSAFCAVMTRDPVSLAYYQRKRREGKLHTQAIIALARRRVTVLWAMLNSRQPYCPAQKAA